MSEINVLRAIQELDSAIQPTGETYTLYICGGAALIFLGFDGRRTGDVDIIEEKIDKPLLEAAAQVAQKLQISETWLNNNVSSLGQRLGKNWKTKCTTLFTGKAVTLKSISRQDLINLKLHATVERQSQDYKDLLWLKPTTEELASAREYTLKQNSAKTYVVFVDAYISELKKDLKK
jgi:hypothetical protein